MNMASMDQLNEYFSQQSYLANSPKPTKLDITTWEAMEMPDRTKYPHVARWCAHIHSLVERFPCKIWEDPAPTTCADSAPPNLDAGLSALEQHEKKRHDDGVETSQNEAKPEARNFPTLLQTNLVGCAVGGKSSDEKREREDGDEMKGRMETSRVKDWSGASGEEQEREIRSEETRGGKDTKEERTSVKVGKLGEEDQKEKRVEKDEKDDKDQKVSHRGRAQSRTRKNKLAGWANYTVLYWDFYGFSWTYSNGKTVYWSDWANFEGQSETVYWSDWTGSTDKIETVCWSDWANPKGQTVYW